ncbi:hypothetical protein J437_LFUL001848 [Ladona fulva]|uniref:Uncharacterized protein n=1 Tax=Ladona fulva TaxID=123851 RepID=A0A8K0NUE3_LADFU|nr:hypothetical protein J437_LFUL001848 [Ladona fulva]
MAEDLQTAQTAVMAFSSVPQFSGFIEQLDFFFEANAISLESKKRAIPLTCTSVQTYNVVKKLCAPEKPAMKTYSQILALVASHHIPVTCVWVEHEKFDSHVQWAGLTLVCLRHLANTCKFDNLEQSLLWQILWSMTNLGLKEQLFSIQFEDLTLQVAIDRALAAEQA